MNNNNNNDMFALYSKREKILLLPILAFVFVTTKIGQRFLPRRANTIIVPMKQEDLTEMLPSLSAEQQEINTAVKTLQYHFHQKISELSPQQQTTFFQMFSNGLACDRFVDVLKTMFKSSANIVLSPKVLNAAWLSVRQNDVDKTTISLEHLKTWYMVGHQT